MRLNSYMPALSVGGSLRQALSPVIRLAARLIGRESAWDRLAMPVPSAAFGPGSERPFAQYFEGESRVRVASIDDIAAWLQTCEYVSDLELFHQRDVWQHPSVFEDLKRGDCEDFALWAWRKLGELGIDAELCVGRVVARARPDVNYQHAWVVYRTGDTEFLFEPAAPTESAMIRRLAEVMDDYVPHFAVNHRFETNAFVGCAVDSRRIRIA
jgi:predicted transglutaminase-like cysteine proteinase